MGDVIFTITGIGEIECIRPLWVQLNEHHHERARNFRSFYERTCFDDRKAYFEKIGRSGLFRLALAWDRSGAGPVGYCIGSISPEGYGEIESIYVESPYRSASVGTSLMRSILAWMDENNVIRKRVAVADGNETAWAFYRKFGFSPRLTVLEQETP
jgi:ribosomal protein S18 acetylase RimI-like enzyme